MPTKKEIKTYMVNAIQNHYSQQTGELNLTAMAEDAFDNLERNVWLDIPERYFEIAHIVDEEYRHGASKYTLDYFKAIE